MRTTLDISDDVLLAAKEIARRDGRTLGETISDLARRAFALPAAPADSEDTGPPKAPAASERLASYGIHPLPRRGAIVSNEAVDRLRDEEGV